MAESLTPAAEIARPQNDDELYNAIVETLGIHVPRLKVCSDHVAPFQALADAYFARHSVIIWCASRGFGGKSYLLATLAFMEAVTLGASVTVLGGSGEQSERVNQYINHFWNAPQAPRHLLADDPSKRRVRLKNGNMIEALMASQASVRGAHPSRLRMDEIDVMALPILDAAMGQPMSQPGIPMQTVLSSTHHNPRGTMTTILERARERKIPVQSWCMAETMQPHGWLDPADVEQKRKDVTEAMWAIEYDLKTPKPEDVAINTDKVEKMFDKRLGNFVGGVGEHIVIEKPQPGATYVTGIDWGKKQHWSVIWTFRTDKAPLKLVSFLRIARTAWPVMQKAADNIIKMYPGTSFHDEGGVGDAVGDNLTVDVQGQILVGKLRSLVFGAYILGIESGKVVAPMIDWCYNEYKYCTRDDLYGSGHPPDSFIAGALAWHAYNNSGWTW